MSATARTSSAAGRAPAPSRATAAPGVVLTGVLRTRRRGIGWWTATIAAVTAMYTAFYPSMGGMKLDSMLDTFPPGIVSALGWDAMTSGAGYVSSTVFSLLGAILALVCAVAAGARLVAGEEEDGVLELELAAPVPRWRVYVERLVVLWVTVLALGTGVLVVLLVLGPPLDLGIVTTNLVATCGALVLFSGGFGTVAFAAGAATGRRAMAIGVASGLAVAAYLLAFLGALAEIGWMSDVSPYHWYIGARPLSEGADVAGMAKLAALAAVAAVAGALGFVRRDTAV